MGYPQCQNNTDISPAGSFNAKVKGQQGGTRRVGKGLIKASMGHKTISQDAAR
jgi:hypothetical protein